MRKEPTANNQHEIIALYGIFDAISLHKVLIESYGYVSLEGSVLAENGAYLIHPKDWSKSDIIGAKHCWPAMERAGLQFIGLPEPQLIINGQTLTHYDGLLNGKKCDLKYLEANSANPYESISPKMKKASKQGAELVVIVVDESYSHSEFISLSGRVKGKLASLNYTNLKEVILIK